MTRGRNGELTDGYRLLWLAKERNDIPVRAEYWSSPSATVSNRSEVTGFRELHPGVWFPTEVVTTVYNPDDSREGREAAVILTETFRLVEGTLSPTVADDAFELPAFPAGTRVAVYEDGDRVESFVVERDGDIGPAVPPVVGRSPDRVWWPWAVAAAVLAAIGVAVIRRE